MERTTDWWALLGPVPNEHPAGIIAVPHDRAAVLDGEYQLGPIKIRPGGKLLTEYLRSEPLQLGGVSWFETWPIFAEGTWPGSLLAPGGPYEHLRTLNGQGANERLTAVWLHRTVCLLSLAFGEAWQVRTAATETIGLPPEVPEDWPTPRIAFGGEYDLDPVPRGLPQWISGAWDQLEDDSELSAALTAWHQGILLNAVFPSYALIAYCGAIEGASQSKSFRDRIVVLADSCPQCGNVPKAQARFWATVGLVRDGDEVGRLKAKRNPYSARSKTAHGAATYGIESIYGSMHSMTYKAPDSDGHGTIVMDDSDDTQRFMWEEVPAIRSVAADLLAMAFQQPDN